ncbi:hypothetical protein D3C78_1559780 [compost metagenome]
MLDRKQAAGSAKAALDFIANQQYPIVLQQRFNLFEIPERGDDNAPVALKGLDNHSGNFMSLLLQQCF